MNKYTIGIDGGGTKTHAILIDAHKNIIDECYYGPANIRTNLNLAYNSITGAIEELITKHQLITHNLKIGIGVAGYSIKEKREKLFALLNERYPQVKLNSDCHIACLAAHSGKNGAIIICGTGVVGYSITGKITEQMGGWGFPHGDIGGAAWIGLEICKYTCKAIDGICEFSQLLNEVYEKFGKNCYSFKNWLLNATPGDFATIALILPQYKTIDPLSCKILDQATKEITLFTHAVINKSKNLPIKLSGGLAPLFLPAIKLKFSHVELMDSTTPAYGAYYL
ncbi:MAG: ROK family protein [Burkholderiales bacterium]|nr:ROK family protein [Burkholderiales bacterium]